MNQQNPTLRFDHREVAVIFSLFVFVSLLMFTVGILVGKGLAQARYEGMVPEITRQPAQISASPATDRETMGTSVTTDVPETKSEPASPTITEEKDASSTDDATTKKDGPLKLIPQKPQDGDVLGDTSGPSAKSPEIENLLKDSRIKPLLEGADNDDISSKQIIASASTRIPQSVAQGSFTVQVGSYTSQKDAGDRVSALKKLGFPYAYFSVKELEDKRTKWYRVWLGYFPDFKSAKESGELLEQRGEVKNYLVRKSDSSG